MKIIGVDIGGSHISAAEISWLDGEYTLGTIEHAEVNTYASDYELIKSWVKVVEKVAGSATEFQLGIAMPGPFDYENGISLIELQGKMKNLFGKSVKSLLAETLKISPFEIHFSNDAEAFLLGEVMAEVSLSSRRIIGLTLGTGLGSAFYCDGKSQDAKLWTAPFRAGIAEDYLGTAWFRQRAKDLFGLQISGVKDLISPGFEKEARLLFEEFGSSLGEFLLPFLHQEGFEDIVLGGKISTAADQFLPVLKSILIEEGLHPAIHLARLGESAAILGACNSFYPSLNLTK